ncbi:hypothetical protein KAR91_67150 [Candidatus Pacearchaeota archaeon]|nr:hypothetical protein [Candidatus Pacearchaeota archaeon]
MTIDIKKVDEKSRVYTFPNHTSVGLVDVTHIAVSESGNHRIKTKDGKLHIIASGWVHISIETESGEWTF